MSAREKVLDAYEAILLAEGERAATLDAVAARAGVSKGGLLYHFSDKKALVTGLLERLRESAGEDVARMAADPDGACAYYVRTSVYEDTGLDRTILAAQRLSREAHPEVSEVFEEIHRRWFDLLAAETGDEALARTVLLIGDGLYYNAALFGAPGAGAGEGVDVEELLGVVARLKNGG